MGSSYLEKTIDYSEKRYPKKQEKKSGSKAHGVKGKEITSEEGRLEGDESPGKEGKKEGQERESEGGPCEWRAAGMASPWIPGTRTAAVSLPVLLPCSTPSPRISSP